MRTTATRKKENATNLYIIPNKSIKMNEPNSQKKRDVQGLLDVATNNVTINIRPNIIPFFMNLRDRKLLDQTDGKKAITEICLQGWNHDVNYNPIQPSRVAEMINHAAGFPFASKDDYAFNSEYGNDTVALQTPRRKPIMAEVSLRCNTCIFSYIDIF